MSLLFPYRSQRLARPAISLGGRLERPRPVIHVAIVGPAATWTGNALVDPGSDDTVFTEQIARWIGIDLSAAPVGTGAGVGAAPVQLRFARASLRIATTQERREWPAWAGFTPAQLRYPLLGFAGFLQFFTATFHGDREEVELTVNALYPGT